MSAAGRTRSSWRRGFLGEQFGGRSPIADGDGRFFDQQVRPIGSLAGFDLALRRIEEQLFARLRACSFGQPIAIDGGNQASAGFAAGVGEIDRQKERLAADARAGFDAHAAAADHQGPVLRAGAELGEAIGKCFEERVHECSRRIFRSLRHREIGDVEELFGGAEDVAAPPGWSSSDGSGDRPVA